jgi:hypothetical protein
MNADKKLARALKQLAKCAEKGGDTSQPSQALHDFQARTSDPALKSVISRASQALRSPPTERAQLPAEEVIALLRLLAENKLTSSAAVTFLALVQPLKTLDLEAILPLAPTAKCLAAWIKAARVPKKLVEEKLLAAPELAWRTPGLDWYMDKGDIHRAGPLVSNLLSKTPRPQHLPQWDSVLAGPIEKARGEVLMAIILEDKSRDPRQLEALAALLLDSPALLRRAADLLPDLLDTPFADQSLDFSKLLLEHALVVPPHRRPLISATIARLATGILLKDDLSASQEDALKSIGETMSRLKLATTEEDLKGRTWILEPLKAVTERPGDNQNLTMTGARHMAVAFEKARQGLNTHAVLAMAARNLGMAPIGGKGEKVAYNPLQHEDTQGGIMPGETVETVEPGWTFRNSVVLRALVVRPPGTPSPTSS